MATIGDPLVVHVASNEAAPEGPGLTLAHVLARTPAEIRVELRRGPVTMTVTWPVTAAADFAAWTRELLR